MALLQFTASGIYCPQGDFYIDPWKGVDRAVITHAHSDHARWGSKHYLAHTISVPVLQHRLGSQISVQGVAYNTPLYINGVKVSLHPSGHIPGAAQVRVEFKGEVWVAAGDYKVEDDGISAAFEPVKCHSFITESTFGLPVYRWQQQSIVFTQIYNWWKGNKEKGKNSVLLAYSLGKAQRIIQHLDEQITPVYAHQTIHQIQNLFISSGLPYRSTQLFDTAEKVTPGSMIIAPPATLNSYWLRRFEPYAVGVCSGWMQVRGNQRRQNIDAGFVLSDHADFNGLVNAVKATGAEKVLVTHGYQAAFARYLNEIGIEAHELVTQYGTDDDSDIFDETETPLLSA